MFSNLTILLLQFQSPQSRPDWGSRSLPPLKRSILPRPRSRPLSTIEDLFIERRYFPLVWKADAIDSMVGTLTFIYHGEEPLSIQAIRTRYHGCPARARWGRITEVLSTLQNISMDGPELPGPFQENIGQFVAT